MSKPLSTYERKMRDAAFKKAYEEEYKKLLFSELLVTIMDGDGLSVRKLAEEAKISPSVIQDLRSGKQSDIKVSNLIKIAQAFGYELVLKKGSEQLALQDTVIENKHHIGIASV